MIAVGKREGYCCRLHRRNGDNDGDDNESESLFRSNTNVVPLRNLAQVSTQDSYLKKLLHSLCNTLQTVLAIYNLKS